MYTKKILSIAATIALVSTASFSFESNTEGQIKAGNILSTTYRGGTPATSDLNLSTNLFGDALIFPYFKAFDSWESEIVIRNTSPHATVIKVSLYEKTRSTDVGDFNVYLSPYDVIRFTVRDGRVYTRDGSIPTQVRNPKYGVEKDTASFLDLDGTDEELEVLALRGTSSTGFEGYIVAYGMTQYNDGVEHSDSSYGQDTGGLNYHQQHLELFKDYRRLMDDCRPNWREAFNRNGMLEGVFISKVEGGIPAPDTNIGSACINKGTSQSVAGYDLTKFGDVAPNTLTGTVRVSKEDGQQSRDLLLPATAISNLSEDNMYLWAEGEFAGLEDRRLQQQGTSNKYYDRELVRRDSNTFLNKTAVYTFDSKNGNAVTNQILITQPTKRILGNMFGNNAETTGYYWIKDGSTYGGFQLEYYLLDEDEGADVPPIGLTRITSPAGGLSSIPTWQDEMQKITSADLEDLAAIEAFKENDGYSFLNFIGGTDPQEGIPAIVTEMTATKVGGIAQTNWIYAPTTK